MYPTCPCLVTSSDWMKSLIPATVSPSAAAFLVIPLRPVALHSKILGQSEPNLKKPMNA
jgi:hypothetical protein